MDELNATVLVVDDNRDIVEGIAILLEREGYNIIKAYDGLQAIDKLVSNSVQLILIDIMMPRLDGLSAIMKIREKNNIPIIVLSAKSEDTDKVLGLSMGADDYIAKPYNPMELTARVKANLRRYMRLGAMGSTGPENKEHVIVIGGLELNTSLKKLTVDGEEVRLTAKEYKILELLMNNPSRIFFGGGNLSESMGRRWICSRKYGYGAYPPYQGKNRDKSKRTALCESGVGTWL